MKRILVINDDPDFQYLLKTFLTRQGFHAETAADDDEAIFLKIEGYQPHLIILDLQKEIDKAICKRIQKEKLVKDVRLILLTENDFPAGLECIPDAVIKKPFRPNEFMGTIQSLL